MALTKKGRYGDLKGARAHWHLVSPNGKKIIPVKLVAKYEWHGKFVVAEIQQGR